jgi:glutaconate CoA-transferase subunit B
VDRVDFVTSVGFGDGPGSRERLGLAGTGPRQVITDLGVMEPDPATCELRLTGTYPGTVVADIKAATGWDLQVAADLRELPPPSEAELAALRRLRAATLPAGPAGPAKHSKDTKHTKHTEPTGPAGQTDQGASR